jgi:hypothetical protein
MARSDSYASTDGTAAPHPPVSLPVALVALLGFMFGSAEAVEGVFGGSFLVATPHGELADNLDDTGFGGLLYGGLWLGEAPVMLGLEGGVLTYGSDSRETPLPGFPAVNAQLEVKSHIYPVHLFVRFGGRRGKVRPYVDGQLGLKSFETKTQIRLKENSQETFAEDTKSSDTAFSCGASAGLLIRVWHEGGAEESAESEGARRSGGGGDLGFVLIDLRVGYLAGTEAEYVKDSSITPTGGDVTYEMSKSATNLLIFQLGVTLHFL